jgi:Carboxypeptidase regulatory-like domain
LNSRALRALLLWSVGVACVPAAFAQAEGKITGVVVDGQGTPQMGATVLIASELPLHPASFNLLTNGRGRFASEILSSGSYTVKVTLAGFLPAMEQHVRVSGDHVTLLQVVLGSVFSSFGQLRRQTDVPSSSDDWSWVLKSSPDTRSVLRWTEGPSLAELEMSANDGAAQKHEDHLAMALTSGGSHPGSIGTAADSPATTFVYDMGVGETARLLMAGQFSYGSASPAGGFFAEWLPSGAAEGGRSMQFEAREAEIGPLGPIFRGMRVSDSEKLALTDRAVVEYGAEFVAAGYTGTTQALRPHVNATVHVTPTWILSLIAAAESPEQTPGESPLQSALNNVDDFPMLLMRAGRPVLENGWHEEFAFTRALTKDAELSAAVFHDESTHTGLVGHGMVNRPGFLEDYLSDAFAYDGGDSSSGGVRVAYHERIGDKMTGTLVYAYGGALAPNDVESAVLRDELSTQYRHSVAARMATTLPWVGTQISAGYKWISGSAVSQVDSYGESLYGLDPYLSMEVRQPLPRSLPCHMEVVADLGNLLAQGYVPLSTSDGHVVLVSSYRFFRGGLSVQF